MEHAASRPLGDAALVESLAHTRLADCYQCGKCTAGCPVSGQMDVPPNQLIRFLQLGQAGKALSAESIWQCVSCQTCTARCPKQVDCAASLDALRQVSLARGVTSPARERVVLFQRAFLDNIRRNGRLNEVELIAEFKQKAFLRDRNVSLLMADAGLAPKLITRRKFHLRGERVKDRDLIRNIFARCNGGAEK
ncbi:MAG TPA: 4Fe-4S dicluster domain-containing protein [Bryobacteraceae bacterium]|nr:4Fe-4S dicluster domain-containing protein [Bryobacteraceae bacterium]